MPKKAKDAGEEEPIGAGRFGRCRGNLKMGLVGLPNVGKSTTFNLFCDQQVAAENFPFCTIEPNETRATVKPRGGRRAGCRLRLLSSDFHGGWPQACTLKVVRQKADQPAIMGHLRNW